MPTIMELMHTNLMGVFNERDAEQRRAAIEQTYATDVSFSDPDETVTGREELGRKAQEILDGNPGFVFHPVGAVHVVRDLGHLAWGFGPEGQEPVVRGVDVALVRDGLITHVYTILLTDEDA